VPAGLVLEEGDAFALHRASDDCRRARGRARARERVVDLREIVTIDDDRVPAERLRARRVCVGIPLELGRPALTKAIDVEDRGDVLESLEAG